MLRYKLRTLLMVLALGPPVLGGGALAIAWLVREPSRILGVGEVLYVLTALAIPVAMAVLFVVALVRFAHRRER
jgi:hypothetical protein